MLRASGAETGLTRLGVAWLGSWGWLEGDLIVNFPLQTPEFGIDLAVKAAF
jgi:hypothetical protein